MTKSDATVLSDHLRVLLPAEVVDELMPWLMRPELLLRALVHATKNDKARAAPHQRDLLRSANLKSLLDNITRRDDVRRYYTGATVSASTRP